MIVRVHGSHHYFRNICQYARFRGNEEFVTCNSIKEVEDKAEAILEEIMDNISFNSCFNVIPGNHFDVFPDCDFEAEVLDEIIESAEGNEVFMVADKLLLAVEQIVSDILEIYAAKITNQFETEVA